MAELFKAMLGVLLLSAAGGGGAEAVSIGWVPSSDRFGGREVSVGKIATIVLGAFCGSVWLSTDGLDPWEGSRSRPMDTVAPLAVLPPRSMTKMVPDHVDERGLILRACIDREPSIQPRWGV